ncbi:MAG: hypothetical protein Fur0010_25320 [Bdellovibrio sp.]
MKSKFKMIDDCLYLEMEGKLVEVHIKSCFPWSSEAEYLSFRDQEDNELMLLEKLIDLSSEDQVTVRRFLVQSNFTIKILRINKVEEDVELRSFDVETNIGKKLFQTKLEDWPDIMSDGRVLIKDLSGDLFVVESPEELDSKSQKWLATYIA